LKSKIQNRSSESILGKLLSDLPHAAQRLRPGEQSPTAGLPLYGFELNIGLSLRDGSRSGLFS
tara:strand:+ start:9334 stop:9522 length:189 start_codon:yes stop_codon:yes gene_type:complete